jgi:hypothetical protein
MLEMLGYNGFRWIVTFETACVQTFSRIVAFGGWSSGENRCRGRSDDNLDSHDAVPLRYYSRLEATPARWRRRGAALTVGGDGHGRAREFC